MTAKSNLRATFGARAAVTARLACTAAIVALGVAACKHSDEGPQVASWSLVDPSQRHPILVSQQPSRVSIKVARGSGRLTPHQRSQLISFLESYRGGDNGNSKLVIAPPSGSANEVASMQAVAEIRYLIRESGFAEAAVQIEPYHDESNPQPPIRISYTRYVAEGPECGRHTTNLAEDRGNMPYPNFGCASQHNLAAQVANPADLLGPRQQTASPGERRDVYWQKYTKGESTVSQKQNSEQVQVRGGN